MGLPVTGIVEVPADDLERLVRRYHAPIEHCRQEERDEGFSDVRWVTCQCGFDDRVMLGGWANHVEFMVREAMAGRILP